MEESFVNKMHERLLDEKANLQKHLHSIADEDKSEHAPGKDHVARYEDIGTDVGEDTENVHEQNAYEVALDQAGTLEDSLDAVEAALERIDAGTYGVCISCKNEIPEARLEANPAATTCIDCSATTNK